MKYSIESRVFAVLIVLTVVLAGCSAKTTEVKTYHGKTFSVNYPTDWQTFDIYKVSNMPESYRDTIPEGVGFAPSQKYPTPVVIGVYTYPQSDPF